MSIVQRGVFGFIFLFGICILAAGEGNVDLPRYPSLSPDGSEAVFSWRGDLWKVPAEGGMAVRLTSHPGDDLRSAWSRDGKQIAFESSRNGYQNLYLMDADGTGIRQVTTLDLACALTGFGADEEGNEGLTFSSSLEGDLYRSPRPYFISVKGGDIHRLHGAFGDSPSISPDGGRVAFTRGGSRWTRRHYRGSDNRDVWLFNREDDSFTPITEWKGNDGKAKWGDSRTLYFLSDREFNCVNLYRTVIGGSPERLTALKQNDVQDYDIAADGKTAVLMVWDTLYTLDLQTRNAEPLALTIYANEDERDNYQLQSIDREISEAALNPDGKVMAYIAYGEVYVRSLEEKSPTRRVTDSHAREKEIAWSPDGLKLYFVSDRSGGDSIYYATVELTRGDVKEEFEMIVNPPEEKEDEDAECNDEEETDGGDGDEDTDEENGGDEDKDVKKEKEKEEDLPKDLDPKRWRDAIRFHVEPAVDTEANDRMPSPSPDGKSLAFRRGRGDLMILDLDSGESRRLITGWDFNLHWRWSADSRYIACAQNDRNFNSDIWIVPADGSKPAVNVSRHPDNDSNPRWSADGKILSFISERVNEEYDLWMVYLDKDLETLTPEELEKYYKDAAEAAKKRKPLKIETPAPEDGEDEEKDKAEEEENEAEEETRELDLEDAYLRLRRVTTLKGNESNNEITPGGDQYIFTGRTDKSGLFSIKWDGEEQKRLMDSVNVQHLSLSGGKIVFVSQHRAGTIETAGGSPEYHDIKDQIRIDLQAQSSQKFLEAARVLGEIFYHPTMKDLDWKALTEKYHALAKQTRTGDEFNYTANRLLGELNGSHLGIYAPGTDTPNARALGRLGTIHTRSADGFKVIDIVPESPAAKGPMALEKGDIITAVEWKPFGPTDTVESLLEGRIGKETIVSIRRKTEEGETQELNVLMTPAGWGMERQLKYNAWRRAKARQVVEWSKGRLGYIHIQAMNQPSLDIFERDLYAAAGDKEGLIIDVRNNGGGSTTDRVLASIMVRPHAYTVPRGADPTMTAGYPQDRFFIQRYTLPVNMLCNEKSFSNAEIISHAFKTLKRGTLVGQETHGAVISTGGMTLIDGTRVRLPFRGWYVLDGTDMENHGAVPDIIIPQTPEAETNEEDAQLRAAVTDLLNRLP